MTISHRLGKEWLLSYSAGALSEGQSVLVASHLSFLPTSDTAAELHLAEQVGGAFLDQLPPEPLADNALDDIFAKLDSPSTRQTDVKRPASGPWHTDSTETCRFPQPLQKFVGYGPESLRWSFLGPGLRKVRLWSGEEGETLWLLRGKPGTVIPPHSHRGEELTLVLQGGYTDAHGHFLPGDVEQCTDETSHSLRIDEGEDCICLALTQGRLRFEGFLARAVQPFVGI